MIYLLHTTIDRHQFVRWAATRNASTDAGHALHILLSALFGKSVAQPFRLFTPGQGDWSLYAYTAADLASLQSLARTVGTPEVLDILPPDRLRSKEMPEQFAPDLRLGFDLRARPVRRGAVEKDAFRWEADARFPEDEKGMTKAGRTREAVYRDWLAERLGEAAVLENCRLIAFERRRVWRGGQSVEGPDATLQGTLLVKDSGRFHNLLAAGVGRHRAYGYGMLMLRPPDRAPPTR